jgi:hypothetical protein
LKGCHVETLKHARLDNSYEAELRKLVAVDLLILDDFAIDVIDPLESRDLYDLLLGRYRTGSIVVTSNRGPDEWLTLFADPVRAQSAIDRFTNNAYDLVIEGESYSPAAQATARQGDQGALAMIRPSSPCPRGDARRHPSSPPVPLATPAERPQAFRRPVRRRKCRQKSAACTP